MAETLGARSPLTLLAVSAILNVLNSLAFSSKKYELDIFTNFRPSFSALKLLKA